MLCEFAISIAFAAGVELLEGGVGVTGCNALCGGVLLLEEVLELGSALLYGGVDLRDVE